MEQVRYVKGPNGDCLVMVVVSEPEMRVIRHAIRSSDSLQLTGKVERGPRGGTAADAGGGEKRQTVVFMVQTTEPDARPQKVRWIRARRERGFLVFMNGPLLDWKPEFKETAPETPVERAARIVVEKTEIPETLKAAA